MRLKYKSIKLKSGRPIAFVNEAFAEKNGICDGCRVEIIFKGTKMIIPTNVVRTIVKPGEIAFSREALDYFSVKRGEVLDVSLAPKSSSTRLVLKKLNGETLTRDEIMIIVKDIVDNALGEAEIAYFVSGVHSKGMNKQETIFLTEAIADIGQKLKWGSAVVADKHSVGGIAGNRTTPIVVSICAAAGIKMPKTSSRAITSAAGTADVIEVVTDVELSNDKLKRVVEKTGACLAWGGALGLAPADDKLIKVERLLNVDPEPQLIASILAKKISVGSKFVLIDIPYGPGAKFSLVEGKALGKKFVSIGKHFGLKIKVVLTDGSQPIGNGVGPVLEIIDVYKVLKRENPPVDLENKAVFLAGQILEMMHKARRGKGQVLARKILDSGLALKKFDEIISAQGKKKVTLAPAKFRRDIKAGEDLKIAYIDNRLVNRLAQVLGCPTNKSSGVYLHRHVGAKVKKGEPFMSLYSSSKKMLSEGVRFYKMVQPVRFAQ